MTNVAKITAFVAKDSLGGLDVATFEQTAENVISGFFFGIPVSVKVENRLEDSVLLEMAHGYDFQMSSYSAYRERLASEETVKRLLQEAYEESLQITL